jgi:hypothetical protein
VNYEQAIQVMWRLNKAADHEVDEACRIIREVSQTRPCPKCKETMIAKNRKQCGICLSWAGEIKTIINT